MSIAHSARTLAVTAALSALLVAAPARAFDLLNDIGEGLQDIGAAVGDTVVEGVKGGVALSSGAKVTGRYYMPETGRTVTCFEGVNVGYILPPGATSPGAAGTSVTAFDCKKLAQQYGNRATAENGGPIWPGEKPQQPVASGDSCPEAGARRTPKEIRAAAKCFNRDAGFDEDWDNMKKKHQDAADADQAKRDRKFKEIQDKSAKDFARLQAKADADAAAARAQVAAQIAAQKAAQKAGQ
jgi:hypothetical protein